MTDIYGETTSVLEFIKYQIKNNNIASNILNSIEYKITSLPNEECIDDNISECKTNNKKDYSTQGFYYERLWDLCIKFGVTNLTLPANKGHLQTYHIIKENPNKDNIQFEPNCWKGNKLNSYLSQKIRSGNTGGYSDITFLNQPYNNETGKPSGNEELYFISVKYFKNEKKISEYDIGKLCSLIRKHQEENRIIKLYIFVKDKTKAINQFKKQHSSSNILIKYINPGGNYEHIYDITDLQEAFFKLKKLLEQYNYLEHEDNIKDFEKTYLNVLKYTFIPRFHQKLFILKINKLIDNKEKNMLVGAIPRSGKSYIMAGTILEYVKKQEVKYPGKKLKFLIMTPAPNETFKEYEAIFHNYIEFDKLGINIVTYDKPITAEKICTNKDKHCVILISKQKLGYLDKETIEDKETTNIKHRIKKLFKGNPDIDMIFLDEAHFGMSTEKTQQIVKLLDDTITKQTIKIYVTATYNKPLQAYGVKSKCKLTWDMNDIKIMQTLSENTINSNPIKTQFGDDIYTKALEYFGDKTGKSLINKFKEEYALFPKPYLITSLWDKDFLNTEKLKIGDREFGWDMNKLFATDTNTFTNEEQVKEMMRYYFGYPDKKEAYDKQAFYRTRGILPRIQNICQNQCRTLQPQHKTTQLWFLPIGSHGQIKDKIEALVNLLTKNNEFKDIKKNYHFFIAIEESNKKGQTIEGITYMDNPHTIKTDIEKIENEIKNGTLKQDNLIILAGQRLQLGISLHNVDIVTLWNSTSSSDAIFQMLFRSMTEVDVPRCKPKKYCNKKKFGFMVDMNPQRSLTNVLLFSENMNNKINEDNTQKYIEITDLINIDEDVLYDKYGDNDKERKQFVNDLFDKLYASWNINVEHITNVIKNFTYDMKKLEEIKENLIQMNIDKQKNTDTKIYAPDEDETIAPGKKKIKLPKNIKKSKESEEPEEPEEPEESEISEKPEINLIELATELLSEFISLLSIFTLYEDDESECILTDISNPENKTKLIDNINTLKDKVYKKKETKVLFLKILNGRLTGNDKEEYSETIINNVLKSINSLDMPKLDKIIISQQKKYYTIHEPDKLIEQINDKLKPKEKEKKQHGEVFTPLNIVNEMLDKLDEAYKKIHNRSIFTEANFKWLDPAVGIGNFPIIIYQRLMEHLVTKFVNEEERRKHILENMLYMVEIQEKSVYILNKIFCGNEYKLNMHKGTYLSSDCSYGGLKFDIILGNPPYNPPKTETGSSGNSIWQHFVFKSYYLIKESGYLLFIHPPGWKKPLPLNEKPFKPDSDILKGEYYNKNKTGKPSYKQIRQGQVWNVLKNKGSFLFIYTNDQKNKKIKEYIPYFPAVDYYVYQKGETSTSNSKNIFQGQIYESQNVILDTSLQYLPNIITNEILDILNELTSKSGKKTEFKRGLDERGIIWKGKEIQWVYNSKKNKGKEAEWQYKKHGIQAYTKNNKPKEDNVNIDKVILNYGGGIDAFKVEFISKSDDIGVLDKSLYTEVISTSEGKHIAKFFNLNIVKFIFLITQYASGKNTQNEPIVANSITIPPKDIDNYYSYFDIEKYKKFIEDILSNYFKKPINDNLSISKSLQSSKSLTSPSLCKGKNESECNKLQNCTYTKGNKRQYCRTKKKVAGLIKKTRSKSKKTNISQKKTNISQKKNNISQKNKY